MKTILIATALLSAVAVQAHAQTTTDNGSTPAIATPSTKPALALVQGENSFTETQAKERIVKAGFSDVSTLTMDDKGIWRGTAMKDGKSTSVGIDYQGNVAAQ